MSMNEKQNTQNKKIIIVLLFIFLAPLTYAVWLYNSGWRPLATSNYGALITPARPLQAFTLETLAGNPVKLDDIRNKWAMIYLGSASCNQACKDSLYKMRQVHILQAKQQPRVQRIMILTDLTGLSGLKRLLAKEYPKMMVMKGTEQQVKNLTKQFRVHEGEAVETQHRIYLMDPLGNLMMYYPENTDGSNLNKDLKKLLRKSQIG